MKSVETRLSQHDREIAAIRKLLMAGMKMLGSIQRVQRQTDQQLLKLAGEHIETRRELRELAAAQRTTEKKLQGLIASLERGRNGHS